jgi:late competence protein required for DNA uptake (superfamily II DNA/RNA helicase)
MNMFVTETLIVNNTMQFVRCNSVHVDSECCADMRVIYCRECDRLVPALEAESRQMYQSA